MNGVRAIDSATLPAYLGDGGRVTRVLLDPDTGHPGLELYEVELPRGGASEFHARPHPEVIIVIEGKIGVETRDGTKTAKEGRVLFIPAGTEHRHVNAGDATGRFLGVFAPATGHARDVRARPAAKR